MGDPVSGLKSFMIFVSTDGKIALNRVRYGTF